MAIPHAASGQPIPLFPAAGESLSPQTIALFKTEQMEVIRLVLPKGKAFPPHKVAGDITVQCLTGAITFTMESATGEQSQVLRAGEMLYLAGGVRHGLVGLEDATALVTIVLATPVERM